MLTKRKMTVIGLLVVLPVLVFAFGTQEQSDAESMDRQVEPQQASPQAAAGADTLPLQQAFGLPVASQDGTVQGRIQDFVFDQSGAIRYLVIGFQREAQNQPDRQGAAAPQADQAARPRASGAEARLVPAFRMTFEGQQAVVRLTSEEIQGLPALENGNLPEDIREQNLILGSLLLSDWSVVGQNGEEIGRVGDVLLNLTGKRWVSLAVSPSGILGLSEPLYEVPAGAVTQVNAPQQILVLDIAAGELQQFAGFD